MLPVWLNPDCQYGKHDACNGDAWDMNNDEPTECMCYCHEDSELRNAYKGGLTYE